MSDLEQFSNSLYAEMVIRHVPFGRIIRMRFDISHTGDGRSFTYKLSFPPKMKFEVKLTDRASLKAATHDLMNILALTDAIWRRS